MDPVVVIPTFFSGKRRARRNSSVTGVYDHATDVDAQGELDRCLASLESVDNLGLVMVLVSAENGIEDRAEEKVQAAVDAHPDLNVMVIGRNELGLVRKRMEALGLPALNHEVSLQGYGGVRNLGLLLAGVLGFDAVVFLDDDEVIEDPGFLKAAMYGLGKHTKKGFPILAKTGFYLNEQGSYRSSWEDQWYDRFWKQASAFNEWIEKAMRAPRLSRSNHVCGGVLALHKEVFKRIPFDAWIARGEDLDYMINLRLYGSDVWFDNRWVPPGHLPVALRVFQARVQPRPHRPAAGARCFAGAVPGAVPAAGAGQAHPHHGLPAQLGPVGQEGLSRRRPQRHRRGGGIRKPQLLKVLRLPVELG